MIQSVGDDIVSVWSIDHKSQNLEDEGDDVGVGTFGVWVFRPRIFPFPTPVGTVGRRSRADSPSVGGEEDGGVRQVPEE